MRITGNLVTADSNPVTDVSSNFRTYSPGTDVTPQPIVWLRANSIGAANNTPVTTWNNNGTGQNFGNFGTAPTFQNSQINGYPAVNFDGTQAMRTVAAGVQLFPTNNSPLTVYMLIRPTNVVGENYYLHLNGAINNDFAMGHTMGGGSGAGFVGVRQDGNTSTSGLTNASNLPMLDNTFYLISLRILPVGSTPEFEIYQNGTLQTSASFLGGYYAAGAYPTTSEFLYLGSLDTGAPIF